MGVFEAIYSILISFLIISALLIVLFEHKLRAPAVPTLPKVQKHILQALQKYRGDAAELNIVELGSGWGSLTTGLATKFPKTTVTGYEFFFLPFWFSKLRQPFFKNLRFEYADLFQKDLSGFDVVVFYLTPRMLDDVKAKFDAELKPGTLIISNAFPLPDMQARDIINTGTLAKIKLYVYEV